MTFRSFSSFLRKDFGLGSRKARRASLSILSVTLGALLSFHDAAAQTQCPDKKFSTMGQWRGCVCTPSTDPKYPQKKKVYKDIFKSEAECACDPDQPVNGIPPVFGPATECVRSDSPTGAKTGDFAIFGVSFHHGEPCGAIPRPYEVKMAAQYIRTLWPNPDNLIVAITNAPPDAAFGGYVWPSVQFRKELESAYGTSFGYRQTDITALDRTFRNTINSAVVAGRNFSLSGGERSFPASTEVKPVGSTYGMFSVSGMGVSFNLFTLYVPSPDDGDSLLTKERRIRFVIGEAKKNRAREPSLVVGDFNLLESSEERYSLPEFQKEIARETNWLTQHSVCREPAGQTSFSLPGKIHVVQVRDPSSTTMKAVSNLIDPASNDTWIHLPGIVHYASATTFRSQKPPPPTCTRSIGDFSWSCDGPIPDQACTWILESADPDTWLDNYFCAKRDIGLAWSSSGPIQDMRCTRITEPAEPSEHTWNDNYLCLPKTSRYSFSWSSSGPKRGKECIQWSEPADSHTWSDNYLCIDRPPPPECTGYRCPGGACVGPEQECPPLGCKAGTRRCLDGSCRKVCPMQDPMIFEQGTN